MKRFILAIAMFTTLSSPGATTPTEPKTWTGPPIGIRSPSFGITEEGPKVGDANYPPNWPGAESVGSYYINNADQNATDTNNTYGYPNKPRKTLPGRIYVSANSLTEIHGEYLLTSSLYYLTIDEDPKNPPHKDAPAYIRGGSPTEGKAVIGVTPEVVTQDLDTHVEIGRSNLSYAIIENIKFTGLPVAIIGLNTHHIALRHCEMTMGRVTQVSACPWNNGTISDIVIYDNWIHNTNDRYSWDDPAHDEDSSGIAFGVTSSSYLHDIWVIDNTIHNVTGDGVMTNGGAGNQERLHHVYIGRNISHTNRQSGFYVKESKNVIISQNTVYDMHETGGGLQPGTGIGFLYGPNNLWIIFNDISNCNYGIRQSDTGPDFKDYSAYFVGNYIHDASQDSALSHWGSPGGWGISLWDGTMSRYAVGNTIANVYGGIEAIMDGPLYLQNNLIYNLKQNSHDGFGPYNYHVAIALPARNDNCSIEHCLLYGPGQARIKWDSNVISLNGLTALKNQPGLDIKCIEENPLMNPDIPWELAANSPAKDKGIAPDAGIALDVYQEFQDSYGIDMDIRYGINIVYSADIPPVPTMLKGNARPIGAAWDIGAYQHLALIPIPKNKDVDFHLH